MNVLWLQQTETQVPEGTEWLSVMEDARLNGLRFPKRRRDWRLGRWTAKRAVAFYLGRPATALRNIEVRPTPSGVPEVLVAGELAQFSISLSHRMGVAMVALAPCGGAIGCDLEWIEPHGEAFVADYFTPQEQLVIRRCSACDQDALVALMWSAKESALKALHHGLRLDTRGLVVSFGEDAETECKGARSCEQQLSHRSDRDGCAPDRHGWRDFTVQLDGDLTLHGCWERSGNFVRTLIAHAALLPPALVDCDH